MTITSTEPTVTPCPVDWCDDAGHHLFDDQQMPHLDHVEHSRTCRFETGPVEVETQNDAIEIGAEILQDKDGELVGPYVNVGNAGDLYLATAEECFEVITALARAAKIAFPDADVIDRLASIAVEIGSDRR